MALPVGLQLGPYRIQRLVGAGGHALVYEAFDPRLDNHVAIKVLAENLAFDPETSMRFADEARALRLIRSGHVATVFDVGYSASRQPYIVLEYADRGSLAERLHQRSELVPTDVVPLVEMLTDAMCALHHAGLVHRDIKPSNLLVRSGRRRAREAGRLLDSDEDLFLADLGLVKNLSAASGLTVGAGTSLYSAPEQKERFGTVDCRSDIYGATTVVVEALFGSPQGDESWADRVTSATDRGSLRRALLAGLSENPAKRPALAQTWGHSIRSAIDQHRLGSERLETGPRWQIQGAVVAGLAAVLAVVVGRRAKELKLWELLPLGR